MRKYVHLKILSYYVQEEHKKCLYLLKYQSNLASFELIIFLLDYLCLLKTNHTSFEDLLLEVFWISNLSCLT